MNKISKKKIVIIGIIFLLLIAAMIIGSVVSVDIAYKKLSNNIKLELKNYLTSVEIKSNSNFILLIDKKGNISNIIFLNSNSVDSLYKKNIEKKRLDKGITLIVKKLLENDEFGNDNSFILVNYGKDATYNKVKELFKKEFENNKIEKVIDEEKSTIKEKVSTISSSVSNKKNENLKILNDYSLNIVNYYLSNQKREVKESDIDEVSVNLYKKLSKYAEKIQNQSKDNQDGPKIYDINAISDYNNPIYPEKDSWYYIENKQVYAYIKIKYKNKDYEYCYRGNSTYQKGNC